MRKYDVRIENDFYTADHIFRIFPTTPFSKVAKEYRKQMHQDPFKFYVGDYLIPENDASIEEIIEGTTYFRSKIEIRVKAILDHDQEHGLYFLIREYQLGLGLGLEGSVVVKAKSSELFSKVADAYCSRRGYRFVFLWNGAEIDDERTSIQIFQDVLIQRGENEYAFITAILEEHYVRDE